MSTSEKPEARHTSNHDQEAEAYRLFLDDVQDPPKDGKPWVVARSSEEAIQIFKERGVPGFISFGSDLGGSDTAITYVDWLINIALDLLDLGAEASIIAFPRNFIVHGNNPDEARKIETKMHKLIQRLETES